MTNALSKPADPPAHARLPATIVTQVLAWAADGKLRDSAATTVNVATPANPPGNAATAPDAPAYWPNDTTAATAWNPLALFMAILPGPAHVTPVLALGQNQSHFIALALDPTTPFVFTIARNDAFTIHQLVLPGITGHNSIQHLLDEGSPLPLIKPSRRRRGPVTALMPMIPAHLAATLASNTLHHPASLHATLTTQANDAVDILSATATWLRCACNHLSTKDRLISKLTLPIEHTPNAFPLAFAATIISDLRDGLDDAAEDLISAISAAGLFPNRHTPAAAQPHTTASPPPRNDVTTVQTPPRDPLPTAPLASPTPPTNGAHPAWNPAHYLNPTTAAFTPRTIHYEPHPPPHAWQRNAPTGNARVTPDPYGNPYASTVYPGHHTYPPPPPHLTRPSGLHNPVDLTGTDASPRDLAHAKITKLLHLDRALTPDEIKLFGHLTTVTNAAPPKAATPLSQVNQNRLYNILGWAGRTPADVHTFHKDTCNAWHYVLQESTKAGREAQVRQHFIHHLRTSHVRLTHRLTDDLITAIAQLAFSPEPYASSGSKSGIAPLAFVTRTFLERTAASTQRDINAEATAVTTADIVKAKLGSPIIPRNVHEVTEVVKSMRAVVHQLFTHTCPLLYPLDAIIIALGQTSPLFEQVTDYQYNVAAEILWQLTLATKQYFDNTQTYDDLVNPHTRATNQQRIYASLDWIAQAIARGTIPQSLNRAPAFQPKYTDTSTKRNRNKNRQPSSPATNDAAPTTAANPKRTRFNRYADHPDFQPHKRTLPPACATVMTKNPRRRLPRLSDVRKLLNLNTDDELAKHLGTNTTDCLHYIFYGKCHNPLCKRNHTGSSNASAHAALLTKTFKEIPEESR